MKKNVQIITSVVLSMVLLLNLIVVFPVTVSADSGAPIVVGNERDIFGTIFDQNNINNRMTKCEDGIYRKTYNVDKAYDKVMLKVAHGLGGFNPWIGNFEHLYITFKLVGAGSFTVVYDSENLVASVEGQIVEFIYDFSYDNVFVYGNGYRSWLNGAAWDPSFEQNKMTEIADDVWEIKFQCESDLWDFHFKFAVDGLWDYEFGIDRDCGDDLMFGEWMDAYFQGDNIIFEPDDYGDTEDAFTIKIQLDLSNFDFSTKKGAKYLVDICYGEESSIINNELNFSKDVWNFKNYTDKECQPEKNTTDYKYIDSYINRLKPSSRELIKNVLRDGSSVGHCFGMASTVIMQKLKKDDFTKWTSSNSLREVPNGEEARSIICYFNATKYFSEFGSEMEKFDHYSVKERLSILAEEADNVKKGGNPVLLVYHYDNNNRAHAVVAYALEPGLFRSSTSGKQYNRRILLYDCKKIDWSDDTCLLFNEGTDEWEIPTNSMVSSDKGASISCATTNEWVFNGIDDVEQIIEREPVNPVVTIGDVGTIIMKRKDTNEQWFIDTKEGKITGSSKLFYYGDIGTENTEEGSSRINVVLPDSKSEYVFETESGNATNIDLKMQYSGRFLSVVSNAARGASISFDGTASVNGNEGQYEIIAADDNLQENNKFDSFKIIGNGKGNTCLSLTNCGIVLSGENTKGVLVEASNATETGTTIIEETSYAELGNNAEDYSPIVKNVIGDVDLDGKFTISDVTEIQKYLAEFIQFTDEQLALADTNGDDKIDISDATHLQKYLAEFDGIVLGKQN